MSINPEIRDQAYQFFIEEAPELLQLIEEGLLTLSSERSTAKVHEIMRAAHSIKGGAASVELEAIKTLAHRLEDIFKALYNEEVEIDTELETLLLQGYDCLKEPLMEQIATGDFDSESALAAATPILQQIEERLGDALTQAEDYIPSSTDLGVDMVASIFEVDVAQGLDRLAAVIANPQEYQLAGELRAQAEVFAGFGELLNLPGFRAIAEKALAALELHPDRAFQIAQLVLSDFQSSREAVLAGDRTQGGSPCAALVALARTTTVQDEPNLTAIGFDSPVLESPPDIETVPQDWESSDMVTGSLEGLGIISQTEEEIEIPPLEDVFGSAPASYEMEVLEREATSDTEGDEIETPSLEDVFGSAPANYEMEVLESEATSDTEGDEIETPSLEDVFGSAPASYEMEVLESEATSNTEEDEIKTPSVEVEAKERSQTLDAAVQSIEQIFEVLPSIQNIPAPNLKSESQLESKAQAAANPPTISTASSVPAQLSPKQKSQISKSPQGKDGTKAKLDSGKKRASSTPNLSVRVDLNRLERMNNLVGELAINRNSLSLQNDQLQGSVKELLNRFARFQERTDSLRSLYDEMVIAPVNSQVRNLNSEKNLSVGSENPATGEQIDKLFQTSEFRLQDSADFDSLEMDSYGTIHSLLQELLEEMMQLEEAVDDITLFARQSNQTLNGQRQMLTYLRDELMWARMLPLGEVLNRFPRVLRDLSTIHQKPVSLKLSGTGVLVDKAALEKLYDPLLHLLRNAFDHGIESPELRRQQGKPEKGNIEIRAYHLGNQTIIEVRDDGQGLNLERIGSRAIKLGLLSEEQLPLTSKDRLLELIFEPGFSTALEVSELSGRGVGLDVVRSQLRSLKGTVTVTSSPGMGTTFTLRLPLTLTISKLLVCLVTRQSLGNATAFALPSDSIEEIIIPEAEEIKRSGKQRFLHWRNKIIPVYRLIDLLDYNCPLTENSPSKALVAVPSPEDWALPLLLLRRGQQVFALEVDRLVTEQELVIKSFGKAIASPSYTYGCTILGDGSLIPVINGALLLEQVLEPSVAKGTTESVAARKYDSGSKTIPTTARGATILVVDDSAALRRTLALTLQKAGYRVLQARDGKEALEQLQQSSKVQLVICDIEMPNMNGFEFLSQRRLEPELSKIPVAMLTSRSNEKHRKLAMHLGAHAYFTKPYIEQEFLEELKNIISKSATENLAALR
ncbi:MAG: response regulator [Xenococcaceae cyanobacterium]